MLNKITAMYFTDEQQNHLEFYKNNKYIILKKKGES